MPLSMMRAGEPCRIKKVGGKEETRRFLEEVGQDSEHPTLCARCAKAIK